MSDRRVLEMRVKESQFKTPGHPRVRLPNIQDLLPKASASGCSVTSSASVPDALVLAEEHGGAVPVTDHGRLVGIVSERECAHAALTMSSCHRSPMIGEITVPCTVTVSPTESLYDCLRRMNETHVQYLPVVEGEKLVGLISREQVLSELVAYLERVFHEYELDQQIVFLQGTYSC